MEHENDLNLEISVRLSQRSGMLGIELREQVKLSVQTFLEAAKILGRFHDLAEELKKNQ